MRFIFGNVRVSMVWCETNSGGGNKKGVCVIARGKGLNSSVVGVEVSRNDSGVWAVFDEVIMQIVAPVFGTSSCITEGSPRNVPRRLDGLNWLGLSMV